MEKTGKVFVINRTVAVYIKSIRVYRNVPIGEVLEKTGKVFVVNRAVIVNIARNMRYRCDFNRC